MSLVLFASALPQLDWSQPKPAEILAEFTGLLSWEWTNSYRLRTLKSSSSFNRRGSRLQRGSDQAVRTSGSQGKRPTKGCREPLLRVHQTEVPLDKMACWVGFHVNLQYVPEDWHPPCHSTRFRHTLWQTMALGGLRDCRVDLLCCSLARGGGGERAESRQVS